eukprot:764466-Hanusia_phi.AAC.9
MGERERRRDERGEGEERQGEAEARRGEEKQREAEERRSREKQRRGGGGESILLRQICTDPHPPYSLKRLRGVGGGTRILAMAGISEVRGEREGEDTESFMRAKRKGEVSTD